MITQALQHNPLTGLHHSMTPPPPPPALRNILDRTILYYNEGTRTIVTLKSGSSEKPFVLIVSLVTLN